MPIVKFVGHTFPWERIQTVLLMNADTIEFNGEDVKLEPFDPSLYNDPDEAALERHLELQRSAADLLLVERAKEWLLDE